MGNEPDRGQPLARISRTDSQSCTVAITRSLPSQAGTPAAHLSQADSTTTGSAAIPIVEAPDCFAIAAVGGAAGRSAYSYGAGESVTGPVEE